MPRVTPTLLPLHKRSLLALGENLRLARLRRKLTAALVCERAGITLPTLRALERGEPGVSIGTLLSVLASLGLAQDFAAVARDDELGRKLQDANLSVKRRAPRRPRPPASGAQGTGEA